MAYDKAATLLGPGINSNIIESVKRQTANQITHGLRKIITTTLNASVEKFQTKYGAIEYLKTKPIKGRETIVFFHGFCDNKYNFYYSALSLAKKFNLIIPDLPGFGNSFKSEKATYSLQNYVLWMTDFIDSLGLTGVHIVGNSLGGALAVGTAVHHPRKIKSLGIINAGGVVIPDVLSFYSDLSDGKNIFEINCKNGFELFLQRVFHQVPFLPWPVKYSIYCDMRDNKEWNLNLVRDLTDGLTDLTDQRVYEHSLNGKLHKIDCPTLVLWGRQDSFFPYQTAHYIHRKIPHSKLEIFEGMGHSPQLENPKLFTKSYLKFLDQL